MAILTGCPQRIPKSSGGGGTRGKPLRQVQLRQLQQYLQARLVMLRWELEEDNKQDRPVLRGFGKLLNMYTFENTEIGLLLLLLARSFLGYLSALATPLEQASVGALVRLRDSSLSGSGFRASLPGFEHVMWFLACLPGSRRHQGWRGIHTSLLNYSRPHL